MSWLLSTCTNRLNRRHKLAGHVFSGRYKSPLVDGSGSGYFKTVCDYVHLNPVRAGLLNPEDNLAAYPWSSLAWYAAARVHLGTSENANATLHRFMNSSGENNKPKVGI